MYSENRLARVARNVIRENPNDQLDDHLHTRAVKYTRTRTYRQLEADAERNKENRTKRSDERKKEK